MAPTKVTEFVYRDETGQVFGLLNRYADALIEIASTFGDLPGYPECILCERPLDQGCADWCPGLVARRALEIG